MVTDLSNDQWCLHLQSQTVILEDTATKISRNNRNSRRRNLRGLVQDRMFVVEFLYTSVTPRESSWVRECWSWEADHLLLLHDSDLEWTRFVTTGFYSVSGSAALRKLRATLYLSKLLRTIHDQRLAGTDWKICWTFWRL